MSLKHVKPGDKLWLVPNDSRRGVPREIEVVSVGRVWGYFGGQFRRSRFSLETGRVDGGEYTSSGCVYGSKQEHAIVVEQRLAWDRLTRGMRQLHGAPIHLTIQDINGICGLLGIPK